ncbi:hypothetical protein Gohar_004611 [Gossypium harknessii]|uniref:DUF7745 domain-containing protein n=1 Tax=Gossypium harknessii TaxID=34285 RepID=A0A7J9H5G7_9ROSI|nr:hypothetical protein [Gossypium harknessii]
MTKPSSYSTLTMVICIIYSMLKWTSTSSKLLPSIGIPPIVVSLLEKFTDLILAHPDTKKRVDVFALSIYGLVIFPKALGHINDAVSDLFDWLDKRVTPVLAILAETSKSLSAYRRAGEERFIKCAQLLLAWFHSHF